MTDTLLPGSQVVTETTSSAITTASSVGAPIPVMPASKVPENHFCKTPGPGLWFYDRLEQDASGPTIYRYLLEQAESKIYIWDPYLTKADADLFSHIDADIDILILTCCDVKQLSRGYQEFKDAITIIQTTQNFNIKIAAIDKRNVNGKLRRPIGNKTKIPHDRFLFIDERRVFLVGSSLAYHSVENANFNSSEATTTMIYEIREQEHKDFLFHEFKSYWDPTNSKNQYVSMILP